MCLFLVHLVSNDPDLLERRLKAREPEAEQRLVIVLFLFVFLALFLLAGFDRRLEWSSVPVTAVVAAELVVLLGYGLFVLVLRQNRYAARVVEVEQEQKVITAGPYRVVRHPLYSAACLMFVSTPIALGSYVAVVPALLMPILLVVRIRNEEAVLVRDLRGCREYTEKVKWRLIPGVW